MKKELKHFYIGEALGGSQEWFLDPFMKLGGCGAVTACDTCIWLSREFGETWLYPFDPQNLCRQDFLHFGRIMKPYLRPRAGGINRLEKYMRGFNAYLRGREEGRTVGRHLRMDGFSGRETADAAWQAVMKQIDGGFPVPVLILRHKDPELKDFVWHWFLLIGYDGGGDAGEGCDAAACGDACSSGQTSNSVEHCHCRKVKAVTYGEWAWVDFDRLWDTGHEEKGGLVLYRWE